jgi:hypothetical protein
VGEEDERLVRCAERHVGGLGLGLGERGEVGKIGERGEEVGCKAGVAGDVTLL